MNQPIHVVAAAIEHDGRYLCTRRGLTRYPYTSHKWELPGGKPEPGESEAEALRREIREELALDIEPLDAILTVRHDYPDFSIIMTAYRCRCIGDGEPRPVLREHSDALWLLPSRLLELDWAAADIPIVEVIVGENK